MLQARASEGISVRGYTKVFLTLVIGALITYTQWELLNYLIFWAAESGYYENSAFGEGEARYAYEFNKFFTLFLLLLICFGVPGALVNFATNLIWRKQTKALT